MAFDGITISSIVHELNEKILNGKIDKIYQPEKDEIIMNIRCKGTGHKLLLTANSSYPRLHLTEQNKNNPAQAPLFCMVLRKHLAGGAISRIHQPGFERIVEIWVESFNELGDLTAKKIIIEVMGKHSNIILVNEEDIILDSAKRITHETSSIREVLPGKKYTPPPSHNKGNPLTENADFFFAKANEKKPLRDVLYQSYSGISPFMADELCFRAGATEAGEVYKHFRTVMEDVQNNRFSCAIYFDKCKPVEYGVVDISQLGHMEKKSFSTPSIMLEYYYGQKDLIYRMGQKTADIRKIIQLNLERCLKKRELHLKTLNEVKNRDKHRVNGELLTANIYSLQRGMTSFTTTNFYEESAPEITIQLDPTASPAENAQKYFKKYNKEKRAYEALQEQMLQNNQDCTYLDALLTTVTTCQEESDIEEIREELAEQGFVKARKAKKTKKVKAKPLRYISTDGFEMYVGKNNKQNDELTLRFAESLDLWFHTKDIPGSHIIVKTNGKTAPQATMQEAAHLAAYYSKGRNSTHVPVDYTTKKNVKKPKGAKPGMVIYDNHQTAYITPNEEMINSLQTS